MPRAWRCTARAASPKSASSAATAVSTASGRTRSWSNDCWATPRAGVGSPPVVGLGTARFAARTGARRTGVARWVLLALAAQAALVALDITAPSAADLHHHVRARRRSRWPSPATARAAAALAVVAIVARRSPAAGGTTTPASDDHLLRLIDRGRRLPAGDVRGLGARPRGRRARADGGARGRRPPVRRRAHRGRRAGRSPRRSCPPSPTSRWVDLGRRARCSSTAAKRRRPRRAAAPELRDGGTRVLIPLQRLRHARARHDPDAATTPTTSRSSRSSPAGSRWCSPTPGWSPTCAPPARGWTASSARSPRPSPSTTTRARRSTPTRPPRGCSAATRPTTSPPPVRASSPPAS